jgi:alanine racemase
LFDEAGTASDHSLRASEPGPNPACHARSSPPSTAPPSVNLDVARSLTTGARTWAVVKADAYGHGVLIAASAFADADGLALIEIENAIRLRESGWKKPILLLEGCFSSLDWHAAAEHRLSVVIHSDEQLSEFEATPLARKLDVFLKFNTGMNRLGFRTERARDVAARAERHEGTGEITLMTHFACADEPGGHLDALARFNEATAVCRTPARWPTPPPASTSVASVRAAAPAPRSRVGSARHHALRRHAVQPRQS